MISLKYALLKNGDIGSAIIKLKGAEGLEPKVAYSVMKILKWLLSEQSTAQELIQKIGRELAEKNEDGSIKEPNGIGSWQIPEVNHAAFKEKMDSWADITVEFDWNKLKASDLLTKVKLTPGELLACEWLIDSEELNS